MSRQHEGDNEQESDNPVTANAKIEVQSIQEHYQTCFSYLLSSIIKKENQKFFLKN